MDKVHQTELNQENIEIIAREIFNYLHVDRPSSVKFEFTPIDIYSKPSASFKDGILTVRAASEVESRKVIGQQAVKKKWSWYKWMLASRIFTSTLFASGIFLVFLLVVLSIRWIIPEDMKLLYDVLSTFVLFIPLYLMVRMPVWSEYSRRELQDYLIEVKGMAEYDAEYCYLGYSILIGLGYLCIWIVFGVISFSTIGFDFTPLLMLTSIVALLALFIPLARDSQDKKYYDRCVEYEKMNMFNDEDPQGMNTPEVDELRQTSLELAQKLELDGFENEETGEKLPIEIGFHKTPFPQCRNCDYSFEDERILFDILDTTVESAKRLLASTLIGRKILLIRPLKYAFGVILMGILFPIVLILLFIFTGLYAVVAAILGLASFLTMANKSMEVDIGYRESVHRDLEKTGLYSPRLLTIYSYLTFSLSKEFEFRFKVVVTAIYVLLIILMFVFA